MNKKYIPLLIIMLLLGYFTENAFGQRRQQQKLVKIESVVVDEKGTPVPNAVILGKEGAIEVLSDSNGKFSIEVPEGSRVLIEATGYDGMVLPDNAVPAKVTLKKAGFLMDDASAVNIAFGKVRKKELVGAISAVNTADIVKFDNSQYLYDAIRARVPGLLGNTNIRGIGDAIFVVDGFPREPSNINIEEIEQITVLKDANAAILWGTQARNGVIMITTKRGEAYKRKINVSVEKGYSNPVALPKYLGSADYLTLYNEALVNDGLPAAYSDTLIDHYASGSNPYRYPSVDYYSSTFLKSSKPFTKLLAEFSGGNDITQYYANVGWIHSGSPYTIGAGSDPKADRFNIRGNVDFKVNNFITSFVDLLVIIDQDKGPAPYRPSSGDPQYFWTYASTLHPEYFSPLLPLSMVKANPTLTGGANLATAKKINNDFILGGTSKYTNNVYGNMYLAGYSQNIRRTARFSAGVNFDLKSLTPGLKLKTYVSLDVYNAFVLSLRGNTYAVYQPTWVSYGSNDSISALNKIGNDVNPGTQYDDESGYFRRFGTYALLDYARTFDDVHTFTGTFVGYFDNYTASGVTIDRKNSHVGLRVTYDYKKKFFADFSSAYVNGFKLKQTHKGGFSPSLGLAYVIKDSESENSAVNYLKVRGSAGIINYEFSGSNYRLYESTFGSGSTFSWGDQTRTLGRPQTLISRADNPNLTFEKVKNINVGMEGSFLNKLLWLEANLFLSRNSGMVIQRSIYAPFVGNNIPWENYNITDYKGGEAGIRLSKNIGDFYFDFGINLLVAASKVIKKDELFNDSYRYQQGKPNDAMFGLVSLGLFQDQAEIDASPAQKFGEVKPGDIRYKDQNDDNKIDGDDQIQIGNSLAKLSYGLSLTLKYKSLSLFAIGNGRNGSEAYYSGAYFWVQGTDKYSEEVLNRWTPETASTATYPRLTSKNSPNNFQNSTYWIYSNNFFELDRVQLNYELPKTLIQKISSKEMTIYLRGENLVQLSKDAKKRQLNIGAEPSYRNYALGLRILF